mgnify:CR=1 FL=1
MWPVAAVLGWVGQHPCPPGRSAVCILCLTPKGMKRLISGARNRMTSAIQLSNLAWGDEAGATAAALGGGTFARICWMQGDESCLKTRLNLLPGNSDHLAVKKVGRRHQQGGWRLPPFQKYLRPVAEPPSHVSHPIDHADVEMHLFVQAGVRDLMKPTAHMFKADRFTRKALGLWLCSALC